MTNGEQILCQFEDGRAQVQLRAMDGTVSLSQTELAALFDTSLQAFTLLIRAIYAGTEMSPKATCKELLQARTQGAVEFTALYAIASEFNS